MKNKKIFILFLFFQVALGQNKNFIEVEIINKHYVDAKDKSYDNNPYLVKSPSNKSSTNDTVYYAYFNSYSSGYNRVIASNKTILVFDLNGKIQQRKGYNIRKNFKSDPENLIEIYKYDESGLLSSVLEQEKTNKDSIQKTSLQQFYYNDKNQLIEKTFYDYKKGSILKTLTFQYDDKGNNTKITKDSLHYTIKEYDVYNQIISSTSFNNEVINYNTTDTIDENVKIGYFRYDKNSKLVKTNFVDKKQYYPNGFLKESEKSDDQNFRKNKKYTYFKNGLLKSLEISNSYYADNYLLQEKFIIKSDFKNTLNQKVIDKINSQISLSGIWE